VSPAEAPPADAPTWGAPAAAGAYLDSAAPPELDSGGNVVERAGVTMFLSRRLRVSFLFGVAAMALTIAAAAQAAGGGPHIMAKPHKVMVNTTTLLKGKGFPANTTIQLRECGRTFWLAPEEPCLSGNATSVTTDARGRFQTSFEVGLCPEGEQIGHRTERLCYVGELETGEDTGRLVGAGKLQVSYP
jgi:hypothetical protein